MGLYHWTIYRKDEGTTHRVAGSQCYFTCGKKVILITLLLDHVLVIMNFRADRNLKILSVLSSDHLRFTYCTFSITKKIISSAWNNSIQCDTWDLSQQETCSELKMIHNLIIIVDKVEWDRLFISGPPCSL